MIIITDDQIFDFRNFRDTSRFNRSDALAMASNRGFPYFAWNGCIYDVKTDTELFWPTAGFFTRESLPFENWKVGYSYAGKNRWLQGAQDCGFETIPLKR